MPLEWNRKAWFELIAISSWTHLSLRKGPSGGWSLVRPAPSHSSSCPPLQLLDQSKRRRRARLESDRRRSPATLLFITGGILEKVRGAREPRQGLCVTSIFEPATSSTSSIRPFCWTDHHPRRHLHCTDTELEHGRGPNGKERFDEPRIWTVVKSTLGILILCVSLLVFNNSTKKESCKR